MKKSRIAVLALAVGAAFSWLAAQNAAAPKPLAQIVPAGALLYVEAHRWDSLLADWNGSPEKKQWLASANYRAFERSRLFLRLQDVFTEYASGVGVTPDTALLQSIAGGETALAIYDASQVDALYVTRLPQARAAESVLWKARERFATRQAAGQSYYVKSDPASRRTACFAVSGDLLLLATREERLTSALALLAGQAGVAPAITAESWFTDAAATQPAGELRLVANLEALARNPSFRSYWVQSNLRQLRPFRATVMDVVRGAMEVRETRTLLRSEPGPAPDPSAATLLRAIPDNPGLWQLWAQPDAAQVADLLVGRVLDPRPSSKSDTRRAPAAANRDAVLGDESDLDARLDQAPYDPPGAVFKREPLLALLDAHAPRAALLMQSTNAVAGAASLLQTEATLAVQAGRDWAPAAVRQSLTEALESVHTTARVGLEWRERRVQNQPVQEMDGLAGIAFAVRGPLLIVGRRADSVAAAMARAGSASPQPAAVYAAAYRATAADRSNYTRLTRMIEFPSGIPAANDANAEPAFFSQNLASLVRSLARVNGVEITASDDGRLLRQSVVYRLVATP